MKHTEHYQLSQFEGDDRIQMEDFNDNNAKIDAALKAQADAMATKANSSTVGALTTRVGNLETGKAEASAVAALQNAVNSKAEASALPDMLAAANPFPKLKEVTLANNTATWSIDLSDIDFTQYCRVELFMDVGLSVSNGSYNFSFNTPGTVYTASLPANYENGSKDSNSSTTAGNFQNGAASKPCCSTAQIAFGKGAMLMRTNSGCWNWANNGATATYLHDVLYTIRLDAEDWNGITLKTSSAMLAGATVTIYGWKK